MQSNLIDYYLITIYYYILLTITKRQSVFRVFGSFVVIYDSTLE